MYDGNKEKSKLKDKGITQKKRVNPPFFGFAVAATLWFWGILFFYTPGYLNIVGGWRIPFIIVGWAFVVLALLGTLVELGNLWKNKGLKYWGAGSVLLIPALILYVSLIYSPSSYSVVVTILKVFVLLLTAIGSMLIFLGVPYLFWETRKEPKPASPKMPPTKQKADKYKEIASIIVAVLSLVTITIQLVYAFIISQ